MKVNPADIRVFLSVWGIYDLRGKPDVIKAVEMILQPLDDSDQLEKIRNERWDNLVKVLKSHGRNI